MTNTTGGRLAALGVVKSYGNRSVLSGADLEVTPGEAVAILGRSGSGKTTLLRIIAGLESLDAGTVRIDDAVVSSPRDYLAPHLRGIGYVFQSSALWPHLTVAENILFGVRHTDREARARLLNELLHRLDLEGMGNRRPEQLSGGEARRVALARALAPDPRILLFDEAFTNLDWDLKGRLIALVNERVRGRTTLLFVTHDPGEADAVSDRSLLLQAGALAPREE